MNPIHDSHPNKPIPIVPIALRDLVHVTARLFYEPKYALLLDMLAEERVIRDDTIALRLRIPIKEVNKLLSKLRDDRMIKSEAKAEPKVSEWQVKPISRNYYYVDYRLFVNVLKYKMYKMRQLVESLGSQEQSSGYWCPHCSLTFTSLELNRLLDPMSGQFLCENCGSEISTQDTPDSHHLQSKEMHAKFMDQSTPVLELLKKTDNLSIPAFVLTDYIDAATAVATASQASENDQAADGTSISGHAASLGNYGILTSSISVDIIGAAGSKEGTRDNTLSSPANALPIWYSHSTITGKQITESAQATSPLSTEAKSTDSKPLPVHDIQEYYAKLSAQATTVTPTPIPTSMPISLALHGPSPATTVMKPPFEPEHASSLHKVMIEVQGASKELSQVTESDCDRMTPEEYQEYYRLLSEHTA